MGGTDEKLYKIISAKPKGSRPIGRHKRIFQDNIKTDLQ